MRIGIIFGGSSREREVSFAGGRTVYDNLNKALFQAVPIFADSFGNFVLLDWQYIYKGSIRDFYPPVHFLPASEGHSFQVYAESLGSQACEGPQGISRETQLEMLHSLGTPISAEDFHKHIDFAFLTLHGENGEDGRLQGLLEWHGIPYSGSGIFASSLGMDKVIQRRLMKSMNFSVPAFISFSRQQWLENSDAIFERANTEIGFPLVVKSARQGSSIGVSILQTQDRVLFANAVEKSLFRTHISHAAWLGGDRELIVREVADFRHGTGLPLIFNQEIIYHPASLLAELEKHFSETAADALLESMHGENEILVEAFVEGREFSCIVLAGMDGVPVALPPTEIRKSGSLYDYRSKYLPGLSRKITPIDLPESAITKICQACQTLFKALDFNVYARIDGFIKPDGEIFLNDPNTTSGMMPSSFFFHQAAEIGLNPSQFLTYIIYASLQARSVSAMHALRTTALAEQLLTSAKKFRDESSSRRKVAVIFGGYSTERHISVESGRNIYEKLSSSTTYEPIPVFLTGSAGNNELYRVPINILLKDNADDIAEKIRHFSLHPSVAQIVEKASPIIENFGSRSNLAVPEKLSYTGLKAACEVVFIALHGRPGEDGELQGELEKVDLPYNGSGIESSRTSIDKYLTNEILRKNGVLVANHALFESQKWKQDATGLLAEIEDIFPYPLIAKPCDDGCSSAVQKIDNPRELQAYLGLIFRPEQALDPAAAAVLGISTQDEFPIKQVVLIEDLIKADDAARFMEITGGMLTHYRSANEEEFDYEVFEPSEALAEGRVLSLEEKFLAGEGQNITPPRYATEPGRQQEIGRQVKNQLEKVARLIGIEGYCRIDAFVRIYGERAEVIVIEVNSLPGMTPATAIFHQAALAGYKPFDLIDRIIQFALQKRQFKLTRPISQT